MAVLLVGAASALDAGFDRLSKMPAAERSRLLGNLHDFDLKLSPEQQAGIRDLDHRVHAASAEKRALYLSVLRRYHAWLATLPEQRQDELAAKPPGERMAIVRSLVANHPVPSAETPLFLRVIEPSEFNPFEIASVYRIWHLLTDAEKSDIERKTPEKARREALFARGNRAKYGIPRETTPADFDEEKWIGLLRTHWTSAGAMRSLAMLEEGVKSKLAENARKKLDNFRPELVRRQAINLYVSRTDLGSVDPERLTRFIAELPPWVPAAFDSLSPDEARRRMSFAYRLVFPRGQEIGVAKKAAKPAAKRESKPAQKSSIPGRPKPKPGPPIGENGAPF